VVIELSSLSPIGVRLRSWRRLICFIVVAVIVTCTCRGGGRMIGGDGNDQQLLASGCIIVADRGTRAAKKKVLFLSMGQN
jgi:hypothetical protein